MMTDSTIAFIGLGLIGGSIARGIKRANPDTTIMAYMRTRSRLEQAKADGIVDVILDGIGEELRQCDLIFLCTPVEYNAQYLSSIRPYLKPGALLTDVGSTKTDIHEAVTRLGMEQVFVGGHPMAGSEKTGYENSTDHLLENAYYIITPTAASSDQDVERLVDVANTIGSIPIVLDYHYHDQVTAAISHLPHIVASSLVNLVKDSDGKDGMMKRLAAGGFKDITRIASSSPEMWEQICMTNRQNLAEMLRRYIASLSETLAAPIGALSPRNPRVHWLRTTPLPWISWTRSVPFPPFLSFWRPRASASETSASTTTGNMAREHCVSPSMIRTPWKPHGPSWPNIIMN